MKTGNAVKTTFGQLPIGQTFDWVKSETEDRRSSLKGPMRKTGERSYIDETGDEHEVGELWSVAYHVGLDFQPREKPDENKEMPKKVDLDSFLLKSTGWYKDFVLPLNPSQEVISFSKLSKRKKLLALIALTCPANTSFPSILEASYGSEVPGYACRGLDWFVKRRTPV